MEYSKFIILCSPRTGSTLLHTYLNSHKNILSLGELLRKQSKVAQNVDSDVFKAYGTNIKAVGIKVFYDYHKSKNTDLFKYLSEKKDVKVIHLRRLDISAQYNSLVKAKKSGHWNSHLSKRSNAEFEFDDNELINFKQEIKEQQAFFYKLFQDHSILDVIYEDLVNNGQKELDKVQRFVGVKPMKLSSLLKKVS